jgi:predicted FMN-binding regulatory protein PaiB
MSQNRGEADKSGVATGYEAEDKPDMSALVRQYGKI